MWLYRAMPVISELATRAYYRVSIAGARVPASGPVLIVANHNNSLVDPAMVASTSGRQVRFLAKSPLFSHPLIGWLIRGVGSVPVYRASDDPTRLAQNLDSFRDVHAVLAKGDAVGIFPEGISHSGSELAPLKTGAARIALGAAAQLGTDFPIVAMGLVFRDRDVFRSEAHVIIGEPFPWKDLVNAEHSRSAVRELTVRIEQAMRGVSLNLQRWEDEPLVRAAEGVWRAEFGASADRVAEMQRLEITAEVLAALRRGAADDWRDTASELKAHERALRRLGLTPESLMGEPSVGEAIRWLLPRIPFVAMLPISILGSIFFWIPRAVTSRAAAKIGQAEGEDSLVTHRVLVGGVVFPLWFTLFAGLTWWRAGWIAAIAVWLIQPFWAFAALSVGERRQRGFRIIRRYVLRRFERPLIAELREKQRRLALRLRGLLQSTLVSPS